jgi:hypothetical protein
MGASRFDRIAQTLHSRRTALSLAAGAGAFLGLSRSDESGAKCRKKCGPCKRCKKGRCKPRLGSPQCGPCRICVGGTCKGACAGDEVCRGDACLDPGGDCPAAADRCAEDETVTCLLGGVAGLCLHTNDGAPFCAAQFGCAACLSDAACPETYGPNRRCISACQFCNGGSACAQLAGDSGS